MKHHRRLVGIKKVLVPAGGSVDVRIEVQTDDLMVYATQTPGSPAAGARVLLGGQYNVSVGGASDADSSAKTTFTLPS